MAFLGPEIIPIAAAHVGERYVLGARAPVLNANWKGPWDCAEFATWCAYQAYGMLFGVEPPDPRLGDAFTGYWWEQSKRRGLQIEVAKALATPGAFLLRQPRRELIGHIAISAGGGKVVEAAGARLGVVFRKNASERRWDVGVLLPGVQYDTTQPVTPWSAPTDILRVTDPYMRGTHIVALQQALSARGYDPGSCDGIYGELTEAAVIAFQSDRGLIVDGEVGPQSAAELGLAWPIVPCATTEAPPAEAQPPVTPATNPAATATAPVSFTFREAGGQIFAKDSVSGDEVLIGRQVRYSPKGVAFRGLAHSKSSDLALIKPYGEYNRLREAAEYGLWAHFIWPTVAAESGGLYARLNSYDAGFFTFGFYQLAAHTPGDNLMLWFREVLKLEEAKFFFPELTLVDDRVHLCLKSGVKSLEHAVTHQVDGMTLNTTGLGLYLNPDLRQIDDSEKIAAARLVAWCRASPAARAAQVRVAISIAKRKLHAASAKVNLSERPLDQCIWVSDILHQGRGGKQTYPRIARALQSAAPVAELRKIGGTPYASRVATVNTCVQQLLAEGTIAGKTFAALT